MSKIKDEGQQTLVTAVTEEREENVTAVTIKEDTAPVIVDSEMGSLLQLAISKDLDTDKLEKLIELKNREEERACKKDFDFHFSEMQKEFEPVQKNKEGYGYKYAPLPVLQKKYGKIISNHGFAYRWREEALEGGGKKTVLIISGWGHTDESTTFDTPKLEATKQQNSIQVLGSMSSYGKRYTFMSGFGIIVEGEDDDAGSLTFDDLSNYPHLSMLISNAQTKEELQAVSNAEWPKLTNDSVGQAVFTKLFDERKKELKG